MSEFDKLYDEMKNVNEGDVEELPEFVNQLEKIIEDTGGGFEPILAALYKIALNKLNKAKELGKDDVIAKPNIEWLEFVVNNLANITRSKLVKGEKGKSQKEYESISSTIK